MKSSINYLLLNISIGIDLHQLDSKTGTNVRTFRLLGKVTDFTSKDLQLSHLKFAMNQAN